MKTRASILTIVVAATVAAIGLQQASADVMFSDNFNRNGTLKGSTPSYVNATYYPSGLTWGGVDTSVLTVAGSTGYPGSVDDGYANSTSTKGNNYWLSFSPENGKIYTLEASIEWNKGSDLGSTWQYGQPVLGMGDQVASGSTHMWSQDVNGIQATFGRDANNTPGNNSYYIGYGSTSPSGSTAYAPASTPDGYIYYSLTWVLDTTNASHWTATYSFDGVEFGTISNVQTIPIDVVGFGGYNAGSSGASFRVDSIQLSVVPEPATFGIVLGVLAAAVIRRRRFSV